MAFLKRKISQAFDSILKEIHSTAHNKFLHTTVSRFRQPLPHPLHEYSPQPWAITKRPKSCPLCKQAGCNDQPFLSSYPYLPPRIILICLGLTLCLLLTIKILTTWIMRLLSSQMKMSTHHVGLTSRPSALDSHLFSKPSIGIN